MFCHSVPTPPEGLVAITGLLAFLVAPATPVKAAPFIAGSFALPSSLTILPAAVPVSIRATGIVPVEKLAPASRVTLLPSSAGIFPVLSSMTSLFAPVNPSIITSPFCFP